MSKTTADTLRDTIGKPEYLKALQRIVNASLDVVSWKDELNAYWQGVENVPVMASHSQEAALQENLYEAVDALGDALRDLYLATDLKAG